MLDCEKWLSILPSDRSPYKLLNISNNIDILIALVQINASNDIYSCLFKLIFNSFYLFSGHSDENKRLSAKRASA